MGKLKIQFERFFKLINEKSFENRIAVFTKKPLYKYERTFGCLKRSI